MKHKKKNKIRPAPSVQNNRLEETVHRTLIYATGLFEKEGLETGTAYLEASKVIFAYATDFLSGFTIAQWLGNGGDEQRAYDAVRDYIVEAKIIKEVKKEVKTVSARVFRSS
jgi:hypothetical protein